MTTDVNEFYEYDHEMSTDIEYEAVSFIDFIKMARESWSAGAPFDVDMKVIENCDRQSPLKIYQRRVVEIDNINMYEVWGGLNTEYGFAIPVRFHALIEPFNDSRFVWKVETPSQAVKIDDFIAALEAEENSKWESLLQ